jgi:hypothetical protein
MAAPAHRFEPAIAAALLSAGAAAVHASAAGPHFDHYVPHGVLFVVTALAQAAWAALVLTAPSAPLLAAGALGNLGVAIVWALSRTVGLPLGPESGAPEPVGAPDLVATSFEILVIAACVLLLTAGGPHWPVSGGAAKRFAAVGAIAIAAATSAAFAATPGGGHQHDSLEAAPTAHVHKAPAQAGVRPATATKRRAARTRPAKTRAQATPHAHTHQHAQPHSH